MADIVSLPGGKQYQSDRMTWDAIETLKGQVGTQLGGQTLVSADAVHVVLIYLEHLAARLGIIPPSGGAA